MKLEERKGYFSIESIGDDGKAITAFVSRELVSNVLAKRGEWMTKQLQHLVPIALKSPDAIFEGLRDKHDLWRAHILNKRFTFNFIGTPARRVEPKTGTVFVVYLNADRVVYNWAVVENDKDDPRFPENFEKRFGKERLRGPEISR